MEPTIIDNAMNDKYTDFSKGVKDILSTKLADHEVVSSYYSEIDTIRTTKSAFTDMTKVSNADSVSEE